MPGIARVFSLLEFGKNDIGILLYKEAKNAIGFGAEPFEEELPTIGSDTKMSDFRIAVLFKFDTAEDVNKLIKHLEEVKTNMTSTKENTTDE